MNSFLACVPGRGMKAHPRTTHIMEEQRLQRLEDSCLLGVFSEVVHTALFMNCVPTTHVAMHGFCILLGGIYNVTKNPVKDEVTLGDRYAGS